MRKCVFCPRSPAFPLCSALPWASTLLTGKISHEHRPDVGTEPITLPRFSWVIQATLPFPSLVSLNASHFHLRFNGKLHKSYINNTFKQSQTCHIYFSLKTNSFPIEHKVSRRWTLSLLLEALKKSEKTLLNTRDV